MLTKLVWALLFTLLLLVGTTWLVLELDGVVEVTTFSKAGEARVTHIWFVEDDGDMLLEAGNPQNPWVQDLAHLDELVLTGANLDGRYRFRVHAGEANHLLIRKLMAEKYGWRDVWIGWLFDTSASQLVRIERIDETKN